MALAGFLGVHGATEFAKLNALMDTKGASYGLSMLILMRLSLDVSGCDQILSTYELFALDQSFVGRE